MADFVAVIRKAVDNLSENTPQNRAKVYDKARAAIRRQLEAIKPRPSDDVIARQIDKLDAAIDEVDGEHVEALPAEEQEADRLMSELEALVETEADSAVRQSDPLSPDTVPEAPVLAPEDELPLHQERAASEPIPDKAAVAVDIPPYEASVFDGDEDADPYRPPFLSEDEHDDAFGLGNDSGPHSDRLARPSIEKMRSERRPGGVGWILIAALLLLVVGGAYAAWSQRDALTAMLGFGQSASDVAETTPEKQETLPAGQAPAQGEEGTENAALQKPAGQDSSETPVQSGKFTQRLGPNGVETDPGPAPQTADAGSIEGRSVAELSDDAQMSGSPAASGTQAPSAVPGTTNQVDPIGVSQKMFLYEERLGQEAPAIVEGSVIWTLTEDADGAGPKDVAIRGEINAGGESGLSALITIKRNTDKSLPASHIIELVFALPPDFSGGTIDQVQRISMKQTEQDQGDALIAVPAQITQDFYMIALNDLDEAVEKNTQLLKDRNWIDIPVVYGNGRRALITLEKGASGVEVFNDAFNIWAKG